MKATSFTMERNFVLGAMGKAAEPETVRFAITWGIEDGDTIEQAEEQAVARIYEMAARERKRRYGLIEAWQNDQRSKQKQQQPAAQGK